MPRIAREITRFTQSEIDHAFAHAERVSQNPYITILRAPTQKGFGRILIIASRKIGNAPQRNKLRRQFKSIFYEEKLYELPYDCIIITRPGATEIPFEQLKDMLIKALKG
jgi:ribonuclease P protein component